MERSLAECIKTFAIASREKSDPPTVWSREGDCPKSQLIISMACLCYCTFELPAVCEI